MEKLSYSLLLPKPCADIASALPTSPNNSAAVSFFFFRSLKSMKKNKRQEAENKKSEAAEEQKKRKADDGETDRHSARDVIYTRVREGKETRFLIPHLLSLRSHDSSGTLSGYPHLRPSL